MIRVATNGAIGLVLGERIWDVTGNYFLAFTVSGICTIITLILLAFIRAPRKVRY